MTPTLRDLAAHLRIAHHIPGRIRLKLGDTAAKVAVESASRLFHTATEVPGIKAISVNALARSCVVEYDPARIAPSAWQDLIDGVDSEAAAALREALTAPLQRAAE